MVSASSLAFSISTLAAASPTAASLEKTAGTGTKPRGAKQQHGCLLPPISSTSAPRILQLAVPVAASVSILLWTSPVNAGVLSGFSGIESTPGPQLPQIDFLNKWNEENQKKYSELDSRFKSSPILKELLEKSKLNKEKNRRETQDKYCMRGAEWGIGDCSTAGMTQEEKDEFIAMLKKRSAGD